MGTDDRSGNTSGEDLVDLQSLLSSLASSEKEGEGTSESIVPHDLNIHDVKNITPTQTSLSVLDVAEYILGKRGRMSTIKLQKLVYYCQAWSLVWDEKPLFCEDVEAWTNGPVVRDLFNYHRGMFDIERVYTGNPDLITKEQKDTIDAVLDFYGDKSAQWLVDLSHDEEPWRQARRGLPELARGWRVISPESMAIYYSSLLEK